MRNGVADNSSGVGLWVMVEICRGFQPKKRQAALIIIGSGGEIDMMIDGEL